MFTEKYQQEKQKKSTRTGCPYNTDIHEVGDEYNTELYFCVIFKETKK